MRENNFDFLVCGQETERMDHLIHTQYDDPHRLGTLVILPRTEGISTTGLLGLK